MSAAGKIAACENCGRLIAIYDDGSGTPKKYCNRRCRNAAKKRRHAKRVKA